MISLVAWAGLGWAVWPGWIVLVAGPAGWLAGCLDGWLADWPECAELVAGLIDCVCGWLAG